MDTTSGASGTAPSVAASPTMLLNHLDQLEEIVIEASRLPFTAARVVNEEDAIETLELIRNALPESLKQAKALVDQRQQYLEQARSQSDAIVHQAKQMAEQLIERSTVLQESERRAKLMLDEATQKRELLLEQAQQAASRREQELTGRYVELKRQFAAQQRQLEQDHINLQQQQVEQLEKQRQQALKEFESIRAEGIKLHQSAKEQAEQVRVEARQFRQQMEGHCEQLLKQATATQQGADRYAEQTLEDLHGRLQELARVVMAGRSELVNSANTRRLDIPAMASRRSRPIHRDRDKGREAAATEPDRRSSAVQLRAQQDRKSA